jgi:hypothetical protein
MVTELGGSVFEITHDLVGDLFRAKNAGVTDSNPEEGSPVWRRGSRWETGRKTQESTRAPERMMTGFP